MAEEVRDVPPQTPRIDRRTELNRVQRNIRRRRIAFGLIGVLLLVIVGILLAGYIIIFVRPPQQLVVRVNDVEYTRGDMVKLLRVRQKGLELTGQPLDTSQDIFQALQLIVENEIISQTAPNVGVTVSEEELDAQVGTSIDFLSIIDSGGKSPAQLEREFKERYGAYLNSIQISEDEHRQIVRRSILREKMRQFVGDSVPRVVPHSHVYRLTVTPRDEIDIMITKYDDAVRASEDPAVLHEAFKDITREFSRGDPESIRLGGDLGWVPRGILTDYDDVISNLEVGKLSDPVSDIDTPGQLFVFMVSERDDARETHPVNLEELKNNALKEWINEQRREHEVYAIFNSEIYSWLVEQLGISASITPTPQPDPFGGALTGGSLP